MAFLIEDWQKLALEDPAAWQVAIGKVIGDCVEVTGASVVSGDLTSELVMVDGPLSGVPYGLKDLFDFRGAPTHNSSVFPELLQSKASAHSELVDRLCALGASCAAKTQMNEFAYGLSGENPHYGDCPHPHLEGCLSGGSSSGSAYMVGAGYLPLAFGTDTGGSIRVPASWCGIYGIRWTPGYCMGGAFPLAESFDTMGWFTQTADAMQTVLKAWFGTQGTTETRPLTGATLLPESLLEDEVFGALSERVGVFCSDEVGSLAWLEGLLPECNLAFNILQSGEAYVLHEAWLKTHAELYDPQVRARLLRGKDWTEADVAKAKATQREVVAWFTDYFEAKDYLILPATPGPSIPRDASTPELREKMLRLTTPASLAGLPVLTVPVMLDAERSVGLQFIFKDVAAGVPLAILDLC